MDHLSSMFPFLFSPEFAQALISIVLAAIVFFYFVHLLRKEEDCGQETGENIAANAGKEMRRQA